MVDVIKMCSVILII